MAQAPTIPTIHRHLAKLVFLASLLSALSGTLLAALDGAEFVRIAWVCVPLIAIFLALGPLMFCCAWLGRVPGWVDRVYPDQLVAALASNWEDLEAGARAPRP